MDYNLPGTKIVITYGPACREQSILEKLVESGATCIRLNTAHSTMDDLENLVKFRDDILERRGISVALLMDLKGPELRAEISGEAMEIHEGKTYSLSFRGNGGDISISLEGVIETIATGDVILLMDGKIRLRAVEKSGGTVRLLAMNDGILRNHGRMNIPGRFIPMAILQERDMEYLRASVKHEIDFVAISFVQSRQEVDSVHDTILSMGGKCKIISKIETRQAMDNLKEIVKASDAVMVARGDLGVEMPVHEVVLSQKRILEEANSHGIPSIVATQMLESMVENDSPTRAEISDVTNAIIDGTDALMLSEESAIGKHPVEAVQTLRDTALMVEKKFFRYREPDTFEGSRITFSIARAAKVMAMEAGANWIVVLTRTGNTARMVCAMRPEVGIIAATTSRNVAGQMGILRGVRPVLLNAFEADRIVWAVRDLENKGIVKRFDRLVVTSGIEGSPFHGTSKLSVVVSGHMIVRGYAGGFPYSGMIPSSRVKLMEEGISTVTEKELEGFQIFIFRDDVKRSVIRTIAEAGKTYIKNSIVMGKMGGDQVYLDFDLGTVYS